VLDIGHTISTLRTVGITRSCPLLFWTLSSLRLSARPGDRGHLPRLWCSTRHGQRHRRTRKNLDDRREDRWPILPVLSLSRVGVCGRADCRTPVPFLTGISRLQRIDTPHGTPVCLLS